MSCGKWIRKLLGIKTQSEIWLENGELMTKGFAAGLTKGDDDMNKIKVGDKVKVVKPWSSYYKVGDVLTVTGTDYDGGITHTKEHGEYCILGEEVEVIKKGETKMDIIELNGRKYKAIEEVKEDDLKEGDYIVCKEGVDIPYTITNEDMNLGKITNVSINTMYIKVVAHENILHEVQRRKVEQMVSNKYFRKATEEEINKYKNGNPKHKIEVGDYVKSKLGRFYEVEYVRADKVECLRDGLYYNLPFEDVTKVELTERELSYIRAGREINEIKAGDIISSESGIRISLIDTKNAVTSTLVCPVIKRTDKR